MGLLVLALLLLLSACSHCYLASASCLHCVGTRVDVQPDWFVKVQITNTTLRLPFLCMRCHAHPAGFKLA